MQQHLLGDTVVQQFLPERPPVRHKDEQINPVFEGIFVKAVYDIFAHDFAKNEWFGGIGIDVIYFEQLFFQFIS